MRRATGLLFLLLAGCASTVPQPQSVMATLDSGNPNFASAECVNARRVAMQYDPQAGGSFVTGVALGLLLGPIGVGISYLADSAEEERRNQLNRDLQAYCGGSPKAPVGIAARLQEIEDLRHKGLITADEYRAARARVLGQ